MQNPHWLNRVPARGRRFRLFCFPYAGGGIASFVPLQSALGDSIEVCAVQLPGRGARLFEPSIRAFDELVDTLSALVAEHADLPFALLGHSLGALLAFEVTRSLRRRGLPMPRHLIVSGCEAPHTRTPRKKLHEYDDDALLEALGELNGTPAEILCDRELMQLLLPAIRADFELVANYRYCPDEPLDVPLTVLAGLSDPMVECSNVVNWAVHAAAEHTMNWLPGDHFFINSQRAAVLNILRTLLCPSGEVSRAV